MSIAAAIPAILGLINKFVPNTEDRDKAKAELERMERNGELEIVLAQLAINREEAKHSSLFVSAARPAILWVCTAIFGYHYLLAPLIITVASLSGVDTSHMPRFDLDSIYPVLMGMLGIGGLRTAEKYRGVAREKF